MAFIRGYAPKFAFAAVAASCLSGLLIQELEIRANQPPDLSREIPILNKAWKCEPSDYYAFSRKALASLNFQAAGGNVDLALKSMDAVARFTAYPHPSRPIVSGKPPLEPEIVEEQAVLGVAEIKSLIAEPGRNVIQFEMPEHRYIKLLRIDILRGEGSEASSLAQIGSVKVNDENTAPAGEAVSINPPRVIQSYFDTAVDPRKQYIYRLRAIGQMTCQPGGKIPCTDTNGQLAFRVISAPANALPCGNDSLEYAGATSAAKIVTSASNCDVRFSGLIGDISPEGIPEERRRIDYKATFSIRVWIRNEWKSATLQASPGERLKGNVLIRNSESNRLEAAEFDTGLEFCEVTWGRFRHTVKVKDPVLDARGDPKLDSVGRPVLETLEKENEEILSEIAIVSDLASGKRIELTKASSPTSGRSR